MDQRDNEQQQPPKCEHCGGHHAPMPNVDEAMQAMTDSVKGYSDEEISLASDLAMRA